MANIFDTLLGNTSANAAKSAAQDTYNKQVQAAQQLQQAGTTAQGQYNTLSQNYLPYESVGSAAVDPLTRLLQNPSSVSELPGYQFDLQQGLNALDRSAAARGNVNSGANQKAVLRFGQGLADNTLQQQYNRLLGASQFGLGATQLGANTQGQGIQANLGAQTGAANQLYGGAGTIGQGDVAAANAQTQALQNLINAGAYAIGGGFGGGARGAGGGGANFLSAFLK